jgi:Tfp pilus assembly protein PilN
MAGNRFYSAAESGPDTASQASTVLARVLAQGRVSDPETVRLVAHGSQVDRLPEEPSPRLPLENASTGAARKFGAIAAAIAGLGNAGFAANVLPLQLRHRTSQVRMVPTYALVLLIVFTVLGAMVREPYQSRLYASEIEQEIDRIAPTVTAVADREARLLDAESRFQALTGHVRGQDQSLEILQTLATTLPGTDWILDFAFDAGGITLSGIAADTTQLQGLLESSPLFQDVQFSGPVTPSPSGGSQFTLEMTEEARQ